MENGWDKEWPVEEGYYWFYGYRFGKTSCGYKCKKEFYLVNVSKITNGFMYIANGNFLFKHEPEEVMFMKTVLPEVPDYKE